MRYTGDTLLPRSPVWQGSDAESCRAVADSVLGFVDKRVAPFLNDWEAAGELPAWLHKEAGAQGILALGYPERWGGVPASHLCRVALTRALCESGSGGLIAGLMSHSIALPPLLALADDALIGRVAPAVLRGDKTMALCVTEPGGGSDVANLQTRATRDAGDFLVRGEKAFITTGMRADYLTVAVRTGEAGAGGVSLLLIEGDRPGIGKTRLDKTGWRCSDTAMLHFDDVRVPAANLIGAEGLGFLGLMQNFNGERLGLAATAWGMAEVCFDDALAWAQDRQTFGKPLIARQVIRHKLVDMRTRIDAVRCMLEQVAWRIDGGDEPVAEVCMLKNLATATLEQVAGEAVQILGGGGYIRGGRVERIFRETKVLSIGGGASEVLADLAARQLGW